MQARAHLKLIVSEPRSQTLDTVRERVSMVQPVSSVRLRVQWLRANAAALGLWASSFLLLGIAGVLLLTRL